TTRSPRSTRQGEGKNMWWKSAAATVAALATTLTFVSTASANPPHVGGAHVAVSLADPEFRAATDSAGTIHGFADTAPTDNGARLTYFRTAKSGTASRPSPYVGHVLDVAWDGSDATYVVYSHGTTLAIAVHHDATATFSAPTVLSSSYSFGGATVVASQGKWWVVWSESEGSHRALFERHTLLGSGERTHAVSTPAGQSDADPSMTYSGGKRRWCSSGGPPPGSTRPQSSWARGPADCSRPRRSSSPRTTSVPMWQSPVTTPT